jgi:hypothetical protein
MKIDLDIAKISIKELAKQAYEAGFSCAKSLRPAAPAKPSGQGG